MFDFASRRIRRFRARGAVAVLAALLAPAASAQSPSVPNFDQLGYGWFEIGDNFLKPQSGPGPVVSNPAYPYVPNNTGAQPTYRVADLTNPILQPWVAERLKKTNDWVLTGHVPFQARERCWPAGVPGFEVYTQLRPVYFVQGPKEVLIINEGDYQIRHVYLDVPHTANPKPSWYGESVGHYENGDTLVVDTIDMNDKSYVDNYLTPHTTELHVVERFKLADGGKTLQVSVTVDDPGAFTAKWSAGQVYRQRFNGYWDEDVCPENNQSYFGYQMTPIPQAGKPDF